MQNFNANHEVSRKSNLFLVKHNEILSQIFTK